MLKIRYNTITREVTGWNGDITEHKNLVAREGYDEAVAILDIPVPDKPLRAYLFDDFGDLVDNPDYVPTSTTPTSFQPSNPAHDPPTRIKHIEDFLGQSFP